jgi:hypothetical protein
MGILASAMSGNVAKVLLAAVGMVVFQVGMAGAPGAETYKHDESGLEKQFEPFLKAYQHGNDKGMDETFAVFRFPNPKEWLTAYFAPQDVERLLPAYETDVNDAETSLIQSMNLADPGSGFKVHCEPRGDAGGAGKPRPEEGGIQPQKEIPVEQFLMEFRSTKAGQRFRIILNFVYVDGAYRFVGGGAPLWVKHR